MRFAVATPLCLMVGLCCCVPAEAQVSRQDAQVMGLEQAWSAQIQLPRSGRGLVSSHLWTDTSQTKRYAIVELDERTIRVSADRLDKYGDPIGMEGAKELATEEAGRFLGKPSGFQVVEVELPLVRLVLVTSDGLVQVLDAETGNLLWSTSCGPASAPAHPAAIAPEGIVVLHGGKMYLLDWQTGKRKFAKPLRFTSSHTVAVSNGVAFVTDFSGRVEAYGLNEELRQWGYQLHGRAVGIPVQVADGSLVAIASSSGYVYIFAGEEIPDPVLRFESVDRNNGSLAAGNGGFYIGTNGGTFAKIVVDEEGGRIAWRIRTSQTITAPPLIVGDLALAATEAGEVMAIDDVSGSPKWITPPIRVMQPLAQAENRILCRTFSDAIEALDRETGKLVARTPPLNLSQAVTNQIDDRLYLVTDVGQVQCLRPIGGVLPNLITPPEIKDEDPEPEDGDAQPESQQPGTESDPDDGTSPFDDPFNQGGGFDTEDADDPFGGFEDPFGGDN